MKLSLIALALAAASPASQALTTYNWMLDGIVADPGSLSHGFIRQDNFHIDTPDGDGTYSFANGGILRFELEPYAPPIYDTPQPDYRSAVHLDGRDFPAFSITVSDWDSGRPQAVLNGAVYWAPLSADGRSFAAMEFQCGRGYPIGDYSDCFQSPAPGDGALNYLEQSDGQVVKVGWRGPRWQGAFIHPKPIASLPSPAAPVPELEEWALLIAGLAGIAARRRGS